MIEYESILSIQSTIGSIHGINPWDQSVRSIHKINLKDQDQSIRSICKMN